MATSESTNSTEIKQSNNSGGIWPTSPRRIALNPAASWKCRGPRPCVFASDNALMLEVRFRRASPRGLWRERCDLAQEGNVSKLALLPDSPLESYAVTICLLESDYESTPNMLAVLDIVGPASALSAVYAGASLHSEDRAHLLSLTALPVYDAPVLL